jgi:hypothetical protein
VSPVDTDQLQRDLSYAEAQAEYWTDYSETLRDQIRQRTSPWPWPKTGSRLLEIWRQRARPNSGE